MVQVAPKPTSEFIRQRKLGDIADWYAADASISDKRRAGRHISVGIDHLHRIVRVEDVGSAIAHRIPAEERMEFDKDVLELIRKSLQHQSTAVVLDTSDIPGRIGHGTDVRRGISAKVLAMNIDSGETITSNTVIKERPEFPEALKKLLQGVPRSPLNSYVARTTIMAERYVGELLREQQ